MENKISSHTNVLQVNVLGTVKTSQGDGSLTFLTFTYFEISVVLTFTSVLRRYNKKCQLSMACRPKKTTATTATKKLKQTISNSPEYLLSSFFIVNVSLPHRNIS